MDFKKLDNKTLAVTVCSLFLILAIILSVFIILNEPAVQPKEDILENDTEDNKETAPTPEKEDEDKEDKLEYLSNDSQDPENAELSPIDGTRVYGDSLPDIDNRTNGIDVSRWQGLIDWEAAAGGDIDFAFIRIGYRGEDGRIYIDEYANYNIQKATDAGLSIGVYFFSTAINEEEAVEEARWTAEVIKGYPISYPVVYNCEAFRNISSRMYTVTEADRTKNAIAFLSEITELGYEAMLYSAQNSFTAYESWDISAIGESFMIWVAQYPDITYPQQEAPDYTGDFDAWQYTNRGSLEGVPGNVNMVVCYFERGYKRPIDAQARPEAAKPPSADSDKIYEKVRDAVTAKSFVNLRGSASVKGDIVAVLESGDYLTRTGIGTDGWSRLNYNGETVYAISSSLTTEAKYIPPEDFTGNVIEGNTFTDCAETVTAKYYVNLRSLPSTEKGEVVGTLEYGTWLVRTGTSDKGWSRLVYEGRTVFAITSYLTDDKSYVPEEE